MSFKVFPALRYKEPAVNKLGCLFLDSGFEMCGYKSSCNHFVNLTKPLNKNYSLFANISYGDPPLGTGSDGEIEYTMSDEKDHINGFIRVYLRYMEVEIIKGNIDASYYQLVDPDRIPQWKRCEYFRHIDSLVTWTRTAIQKIENAPIEELNLNY